MQYAKSFTAIGVGPDFSIRRGDSFTYAISGTFDQTWALQKATGGAWETVTSGTGEVSDTIVTASEDARYRIASLAAGETAGTMVTTITENVKAGAMRLVTNAAGQAKAGATAGWVVAAGANVALVTCPASQTAATLVVPINGLKVGQKITGFHLVGQIESAGGTVTVDAALRKHTAAAADVADAAVASITQLSVTADAVMSASNTRKNDLDEVVAADETFYVLVTATTAGSTDIALQSVVLEVEG